MNRCMLIGMVTAFPIVVVLMYTMTDMEAVIASPLPSAELLFQATGSKPVTTFLMCWIILVYATSICSAWVASGRVTWAFARDVSL
jgi:choline transport protein